MEKGQVWVALMVSGMGDEPDPTEAILGVYLSKEAAIEACEVYVAALQATDDGYGWHWSQGQDNYGYWVNVHNKYTGDDADHRLLIQEHTAK